MRYMRYLYILQYHHIYSYYDEVYNSQKKNAILVPEFQYYDEGSENDTFLKTLIKQLKSLKNSLKRIRKINKENLIKN